LLRKSLLALWPQIFCIVSLFLVSPSFAADGDPAFRVVVLNIPGGGSDDLVARVDAIEGVEALDQSWFVKEVKTRSIKTKGLMRRAKDLKWVMNGGKVDRIVYVEEEGGRYKVNFIGLDGEIRREFAHDMESGGLSESAGSTIVAELRDDLGLVETPQVLVVAPTETAEVDPVGEQPAETSASEASKTRGAEGLFFEVAGRLLKRDLGVNGSNGAVLTYPSQFYPGGSLKFGYFLDGGATSSTGVVVGLLGGMASVAAAADPGQPVESKSLLHVEGELMVDHRILMATPERGAREAVKFDLQGGVRYVSYSVDQGALPSTSTLAVVLGASVAAQALTADLVLRASFQISPFGTWIGGGDNYGESSYVYGFGGGIGGVYAISSSLGFMFGWDVRMERTSFSGNGTQDYVDAEAFELVQGLVLGLVYSD
jgi:hypothetical protein